MLGLEFSGTIARLDMLVDGALTTIWLSGISMVISLAIGAGCAVAMGTGRVPRYLGLTYVELIRNTPFLVQIFVIYFGLPSIGLRISPEISALIGLSIYGGAYATEILRAGLESVDRGQIEAAQSLGMHRGTIFGSIVFLPALALVYWPLSGQFILLLQSSSLLSAISVAELTAQGNSIQSLTFRNFEAYIFVALAYLILTSGFRQSFKILHRLLFPFKHQEG